MKSFLLKRSGYVGMISIALTLFAFILIHMAPGDPQLILTMSRFGRNVTPKQMALVTEDMGLSKPIYVQYIIWLKHVLKGDLGNSIRSDHTVLSELFSRLPATLILGLSSFVLSLFIAVPIGIIAAVKENSFFDNIVMFGSIILISVPGFWIALLLILVFSATLNLLPAYGQGGFDHLVLPIVSLSLGMTATAIQLTRTCMLEVLRQDYIWAARSRGLPEKWIILRHALTNALVPIASYNDIKLARIFQATVIVETIFAWEGIGKLMVDSCFTKDFPMIQGCVLLVGLVFITISFALDIIYMFLNPRSRFIL